MGRAWVICKKIFSVSLVFNALLTISCCIGILSGYYYYYYDGMWQPFYPYIFNGNLFWLVIAAAAINIFPSALIGRKLHTGRFLFHHYFYGFLVLAVAVVFVFIFSPVSLAMLFFVNNTSVEVNVGRFLILGGLTLVLDDLPDVSKHMDSGLNWLKARVLKHQKMVVAAQLLCGSVSMYFFAGLLVGMSQNPDWITLANALLISSIFITGITSFVFVQKRMWHHAVKTLPLKHLMHFKIQQVETE